MEYLLLIILGVYGFFFFGRTIDVMNGERSGVWESDKQVIPPSNPQFNKIIEATEDSKQLPDGTIVSRRNIKQWQ